MDARPVVVDVVLVVVVHPQQLPIAKSTTQPSSKTVVQRPETVSMTGQMGSAEREKAILLIQ